MAPVVSVVMGVYNGEPYLAEAVESILGQSYRDFEFVIIDDGSTDRTREMLEAYRARDERLRVYHQENRGHTATLIRGCALARGRYIARMDADDLAFPERFERQVALLEQHPRVALVGGAVEMIDGAGRRLSTELCPTGDARIREALQEYGPYVFYHSTVMMRAEAFRAVGGYRIAFDDAEDYDLFLRLSERFELANLPDPVGGYRISAQQISQRSLRRQVTATEACRVAARMRRESGRDPFSGVEQLTPELLREVGIAEELIRERVAEALLWRAGLMHQTGSTEAALRLLEEARQCARTTARRKSLHVRILRQRAAIQYRQGHVLRSLSANVRAYCVDPIRATAILTRRCAGLFAVFQR